MVQWWVTDAVVLTAAGGEDGMGDGLGPREIWDSLGIDKKLGNILLSLSKPSGEETPEQIGQFQFSHVFHSLPTRFFVQLRGANELYSTQVMPSLKPQLKTSVRLNQQCSLLTNQNDLSAIEGPKS